MNDPKDAVRAFVQQFTHIYSEDPKISQIALLSVFITCFGMLEPDERDRVTVALLLIMKDISGELFEDGQDFISFLKEKVVIQEFNEDAQ